MLSRTLWLKRPKPVWTRRWQVGWRCSRIKSVGADVPPCDGALSFLFSRLLDVNIWRDREEQSELSGPTLRNIILDVRSPFEDWPCWWRNGTIRKTQTVAPRSSSRIMSHGQGACGPNGKIYYLSLSINPFRPGQTEELRVREARWLREEVEEGVMTKQRKRFSS